MNTFKEKPYVHLYGHLNTSLHLASLYDGRLYALLLRVSIQNNC